MKIRMVEVVLGLVLACVVVSAFAQTWTLAGGTNRSEWSSIGSSADGKIICAVASGSFPIFSTDYGKTWSSNTTVSGVAHQNNMAITADGKTIIAAMYSGAPGNRVLVSTNYGVSWAQTSSIPATCASCSADGTRLIAANYAGALYVSTNSGATWRTNSAAKFWNAVACSGNGSQFLAAVYGEKIYSSTDAGVTWNALSAPSKSWNGLCSSGDGKRLAAIASDAIYLSSDAGNTWLTNTSVSGQSVASSADGAKLMVSGNTVYLSDDYGMTWRTNITTGTISSGAACSADGCRLAIACFSPQRGLWVSQTNPSPRLEVQMGITNLALKWIVPSTNFVLQQNGDLATTNWASVTNFPSLNYTNIQFEVRVPASETNGYFRLMQQ